MTLLITDFTYNWVYLELILLINNFTYNSEYKHLCNVTFIDVISKVIISLYKYCRSVFLIYKKYDISHGQTLAIRKKHKPKFQL